MQNMKRISGTILFVLLVGIALLAMPASAVGFGAEQTPSYAPFGASYSIRGSLGITYQGETVTDNQTIITLDFPQMHSVSRKEADSAANDTLSYAEHYPQYIEFVKNWSQKELSDEIYDQMNTVGRTDSVEISSKQSGPEQTVYGNYPNPIQFCYDDSGKPVYFIASDNEAGGSVSVQIWDSEYIADHKDEVYDNLKQYGQWYGTPISEERAESSIKKDIKAYCRFFDESKDADSTLYELLEQHGYDPMVMEVKCGEIKIDKLPNIEYDVSGIPSEWQAELGLSDRELNILGKIWSDIGW